MKRNSEVRDTIQNHWTESLPGELSAGRAAVLLEGGMLSVCLREDRLLLVAASGEGFTSGPGALDILVARLLRGSPRLPVVSEADTGKRETPPYRVPLPKETLVRFTDPQLFWMFLAGRLGDGGRSDYLGRRNRIVDTTEVTGEMLARDAESGRLWVCKAEWTRRDAGQPENLRVSWLVRETAVDSSASSSGPGKDLARSLYRLQNAFRSAGFHDCRVGISRQGISRIDGKRVLVRLVTEYWEGFWPKGALERVQEELGRLHAHRNGLNDEGAHPVGDTNRSGPPGVPSVVTVAILEMELKQQGLLSLAFRLPASREEQLGGYAIRTIYAFLAQGGRSLRSFVDSAYRSGERFRAFSTVYYALGANERTRIDRVLGPRRLAALADANRLFRGGDPGVSGGPIRQGSSSVKEPWRIAAVAAETLIGEYARSTRRRGYAADAQCMKILDTYYISPRSNNLREIWDRRRQDPELERLLQDGRLSLLRIYGRNLPRAVLVDAATGTTEGAKRRIAAIFSRRGRRLFLEDVDVLEEAIRRGDSIEWDRLLAAQEQLTALARRIQH